MKNLERLAEPPTIAITEAACKNPVKQIFKRFLAVNVTEMYNSMVVRNQF